MADQEHDPEVSRRYRELGRDEPPPELDARIRTEARRAVVLHPAPLVPPTGRRSWYFPVAAAAVIVLAVAVTWQVEREQGDDAAMLSQGTPALERWKEKRLSEEEPQKQAELQKPAPFAAQSGAAVGRKGAPAAADEARDQAPAESVSGAISQSRQDALGQRENRARQERPSSGTASAPAAQRQMQRDEIQPQARAKVAEEPPEKWLERIAQLRQQRRHDEADKALAEFRKRYPDYKIPEAMLEKVEKR